MNLNSDNVSIIIPVYNSEKFLSESIKSVLAQSYKNIKIFAINDGSTDRSLEILKKYSNDITIISQSNQGLASALNTGIKNINNSRWFKWFSPDDILYQNSIETCVNVAKTLPENTIIYSNWELIDNHGKKLRDFYESNYNDLEPFDFNVRLLDSQQINVNAALIPTSLLEIGCKINDLEDPVAIDYDFFLQAGILYNARFHLIPKPLMKYRIHKNQLSHKKISKSLSFLPKVRCNILSGLEPSMRIRYQKALKSYKNKKPISKKILETGLKISTQIFPDWLTDQLLLFYLNKIRRIRN